MLIPIALAAKADMYIFAVTTNGQGMAAKLIVNVVPGTGQISLTLNSIVGEDTQRSIDNAIHAAVEEANKDFYDYDYQVTIESGAEYVSGPSAGLPIALATYAALNNEDVPDYVSGTGTIDEDGSVGPVGGIYEKAKAAAEKNITIFLIPKGERYVEAPKEEEIEPGIVVPSTGKVDIVKLAKKEWNMDVYEVANLHQAIEIVFKGVRPEINAPSQVENPPELNFIPVQAPTKYSKRFGVITLTMMKELNKLLENNCTAPVQKEAIDDLLKVARSYLDRAWVVYDRGYYYTAGNYTFLGLIDASTAEAICEHPSILDPTSLEFELYTDNLQKKLDDAKSRAEKFTLTTENYEWVGGARERLIRAEFTLTGQLPSDPIQRIETLKSVEYWIKTANQMMDVAEEMNGGQELNNLEQFAQNEIVMVEDLIISSQRSGGYALQRLEWAKEAYRRGWYFAAFAEAALAKGSFIGANIRDDQLEERVRSDIRKTEDYKGMWAELYRDHGLYYEQAAREYGKIGKTDKKKEMLRTALQMLESAEEFSTLSKSVFVPMVSVKVKTSTKLPTEAAIGTALLILALFFLYLAVRGEKKPHPHLVNIPKEKRDEARETIREIEKLNKVLKELEKAGKSPIIEKESERIKKEIEKLEKKLERLAQPEPPRRSSHHARGRRR